VRRSLRSSTGISAWRWTLGELGRGVDALPGWFEPLLSRMRAARPEDFTRFAPPDAGGRAASVLVLLGEDPETGPDVLVLQRAATLRRHAGQPAFPGGAAEPGDADAAGTALREASEEVGLDPSSVTVVAELPELWVPASEFVVTPVLAWWHRPHDVHPRDVGEVAHVARVPVTELVDPANRLRIRYPDGHEGDAFEVRGMLVWGFTAGIISTLLDMAGWARPWSPARIGALPVVDTPAPSAGTDAEDE
jgi:8-oxo-dGTP pyrophosphatase MutT (NUDIX family)